jgi:hypothetical protein
MLLPKKSVITNFIDHMEKQCVSLPNLIHLGENNIVNKLLLKQNKCYQVKIPASYFLNTYPVYNAS